MFHFPLSLPVSRLLASKTGSRNFQYHTEFVGKIQSSPGRYPGKAKMWWEIITTCEAEDLGLVLITEEPPDALKHVSQ
jgi:hypothetical protein